jgi:NADPH2:quinone reductase
MAWAGWLVGVVVERFGAARDVLIHGDLPDPAPGPGEVLVRLRASGVNPSDVKLRAGARARAVMGWPRIVPHSDGAGVVEAVGADIDPARIGERVWIWNGGWQRQYGTAAELIALPAEQAVHLPDRTGFAEAACLGIPALTAWHTVFADGPVADKTLLVTGGAGTVGRYACQMARLGGARVITTVSSAEKAAHSTAAEWVNYRDTDVAEAVMDMTGGNGVDRIVEVDFAAGQATALALLKPGGVIATYASAADMQPRLDFYPLMFRNLTLRMILVYLLDPETRRRGEAQLTEWLAAGALSHAVVPGGTLADCVTAHETVEAGAKLGTVVLEWGA